MKIRLQSKKSQINETKKTEVSYSRFQIIQDIGSLLTEWHIKDTSKGRSAIRYVTQDARWNNSRTSS